MHIELQKAHLAKQMPAVTHLEPFYTSFYASKDLLLPVDDLVAQLGGPGRIYEDLLATVRFSNKLWGIPQHYSVATLVARRDLMEAAGVTAPSTWSETVEFAARLADPSKQRAGCYFPGGDKFALDAMFFLALASNGGSLLGPDGNPNLNVPQVHESLRYLQSLAEEAPQADWRNAGLTQMFGQIVQGSVGMLPLVPARGTAFFDANWVGDLAANSGYDAPENFIVFDPPVGPSGTSGIAMLDCEPFVVINQRTTSSLEPQQAAAVEAAGKQYLSMLFAHDNYLALTSSLPIALAPIFRDMQDEYAALPAVMRWSSWYDQARRIIDSGHTSPFFSTNVSDLSKPYLYVLYSENVVTDMVLDVLNGRVTPEVAAANAQDRAMAIATSQK